VRRSALFHRPPGSTPQGRGTRDASAAVQRPAVPLHLVGGADGGREGGEDVPHHAEGPAEVLLVCAGRRRGGARRTARAEGGRGDRAGLCECGVASTQDMAIENWAWQLQHMLAPGWFSILSEPMKGSKNACGRPARTAKEAAGMQ
jgi:hypothetical protein